MTQPSACLNPGDRAPDVLLPAAHATGVVSLAAYRGRSPVLLAIFRGLYCPFCRRHIVEFTETGEKLGELGVAPLGVVATAAERARLYFRYRPTPVPFGADQDLLTHRAYGLPRSPLTSEIIAVDEAAAVRVISELGLAAPSGGAYKFLESLDGFQPTASDDAELQRHGAQLEGQFLIDRDGIIRWANIEGARGVESIATFPSQRELLEAARGFSDT